MNRILIKKADPVTQTKSGVLIPENKRPRVSKGKVVAVGTGTVTDKGNSIPCCLKVGDTVILPDYGGTKITYSDKQEFYLYRENDILAKVNE